ncbi:MAG: Glycogen accumulation regulator GarA [Pelotomaculum sp. PtaB.Bin013]|nr:MAG: Glycogen accumulation regulator GarA [Pelotomaculum sp. PtaB.Bin013]
MGVFSGLEGSLEKYIEGFFKDKFKGRIQPAEIAKRLAREMRDRRRVSVNKIYVPNKFTVYLNASDYDNIATIASSLSKELQEYVNQKAGEKKYTLAGPPVVDFVREEIEEIGYMKIESGFSEELPENEPLETNEEVLEHTQLFRLTKDVTVVEKAPAVYARLQVIAGPETGRIINVRAVPQVIGRHSGCDIVLSDSSVSRRQARLERIRGRFTITDLGSTNGTWVNGFRIMSKVLEPGDEVAMGTTVCAFKVD